MLGGPEWKPLIKAGADRGVTNVMAVRRRRRGGAEFDSSEGFRDFIDYNGEAEALGFHSTFVVEHHFTGCGQVSATLNLLTWVGPRTPAASRHRCHGAALAQPGAAGGTGRDARSPVRGARLDFGIGKGYRYNEFAGFRMSMEEADARFEECLEVLPKAWTADEPSAIGASTESSTTSWSNRHRHRNRTCRSGWVRAASALAFHGNMTLKTSTLS
jgi:hypothetical protein